MLGYAVYVYLSHSHCVTRCIEYSVYCIVYHMYVNVMNRLRHLREKHPQRGRNILIDKTLTSPI